MDEKQCVCWTSERSGFSKRVPSFENEMRHTKESQTPSPCSLGFGGGDQLITKRISGIEIEFWVQRYVAWAFGEQ